MGQQYADPEGRQRARDAEQLGEGAFKRAKAQYPDRYVGLDVRAKPGDIELPDDRPKRKAARKTGRTARRSTR